MQNKNNISDIFKSMRIFSILQVIFEKIYKFQFDFKVLKIKNNYYSVTVRFVIPCLNCEQKINDDGVRPLDLRADTAEHRTLLLSHQLVLYWLSSIVYNRTCYIVLENLINKYVKVAYFKILFI